MPLYTVPVLKFVGTVSLGLLTGVSYTTATQSLPSLLTFPSATAAYTTFRHQQRLTKLHLLALSAVSVSTYSLAFVLAPRRGGRHPYLLWTSLVVAIGGGLDYFLRNEAGGLLEQRVDEGVEESLVDLDERGVNGEEVRKEIEGWKAAQGVRGCVSGLAFLMAVVGLWGDGVGIRMGVGA